MLPSQMHTQFTPDVEMVEGQTSPPPLLTEADLISLMEKHGIGITLLGIHFHFLSWKENVAPGGYHVMHFLLLISSSSIFLKKYS